MSKRTAADRSALSVKTAVAYARVSSKEQEKEGFSIPSQAKLLQGYAQNHGIVVVKEFVDIETAKRAGRTGFTEMVAYLRKSGRGCHTILVEKTDRLYRNFKDYVTLDDLGLEIHLVKEGEILSSESRSHVKFIHGIKVLMAKNFIDNLSEESKKGLLEKAEAGMWPSQAPLGYRTGVGPSGKKLIEVDPITAPIVTRIFEAYATGRHSLLEITRTAKTDGLRSKKGTPVPKATIHTTLRNALYAGEIVWHGKTYPGVHTPLVSRELWDRVQGVLDGRFATRKRKSIHEFAFSRLITCGHCGCSLVGEIKKGRYVYYRCTGYKGRCPEPYVREEILDERFAAMLDGLKFDPEVVTWVSQALRESHRDEKQFRDEAIARLQTEHRRLQNRIDAMYVDKLDGRIDNAAYDRMSAACRVEQDAALRTIRQHQTADRAYADEGVRLLELAQRASAMFREQPSEQKSRLLNFVLSNSTWANGTLSVTYRQPFDMLAESARVIRIANAADGSESGVRPEWLRLLDSNQRQGG